MIVVKILILILLFGTTSIIGFLMSQKYVNRVRSLIQIDDSLSMFQTKISYTYESIPDVFKEIASKTKGSISELFLESSKKMEKYNAGISWDKTLEEKCHCLEKEDIDILKGFGKLLGKTDLDGQISQLQVTREFLKTQIKQAEQEKDKNEKLYKKLGVIFGMALVIMLI